MYFFLTSAVKNRFILELRKFWSLNPRYQDLIDNIQGKYGFSERPQYGIIVKAGSASRVQFSADNFLGTGFSYAALAKIPGSPGLSVEWVREDSIAIRNNGGFPSPAGVYYCEMTAEDEFHVDPLLDVHDERLTLTTSTEGTLQQVPVGGSLRLFEIPSGRLLRPETDYTVGSDGVTIHLAADVLPGTSISADYRYAGETTGPWKVLPQSGLNKPIPGVVMVFGRRYRLGDKWAVIINPTREPAYLLYGGKWELGLDLDIISRDPEAQMEIADQTAMYLWASLRSSLVDEGIDIQDVSMTGESEEIYDETGDDYYYNASLSMTVQTDWFLATPILPRLLAYQETIKNLSDASSLAPFQDPYFSAGKLTSFEMVK